MYLTGWFLIIQQPQCQQQRCQQLQCQQLQCQQLQCQQQRCQSQRSKPAQSCCHKMRKTQLRWLRTQMRTFSFLFAFKFVKQSIAFLKRCKGTYFFITPYSQNASFFHEKCKLFYKSLIDRLKQRAFRMAQALCLCAFCTIFAACITSQARKPPTLPWGANSISPRRAPWVASSRRLV